MLPTGIAIALPEGYAAFVHPRSGLAARAGLGLVNAPGTIDSGYRGEIKVIVINHDPSPAAAPARGERIAQLVFQRVEQAPIRRGRRAARVRPRRRRARLDRRRRGLDHGIAASATRRAAVADSDASGGADAKAEAHRARPSSTRPRRGSSACARSPSRPTGRTTSATRPTTRSRASTSARCRAGRRGPRRAARGQRGAAGHRRDAGRPATGTMQLGVFAAPRNEGIWDEVRAEIAASLDRSSAARRASATDGAVRHRADRHAARRRRRAHARCASSASTARAGSCGRCWPAGAADAAKAEPLQDALRRVVVVRGTEPLPVREPVPLRCPRTSSCPTATDDGATDDGRRRAATRADAVTLNPWVTDCRCCVA